MKVKGIYLNDKLVNEFNELQRNLFNLNIRVGIRYRRLLRFQDMSAPETITSENERMLSDAVSECNKADRDMRDWLALHDEFVQKLDIINGIEDLSGSPEERLLNKLFGK